MGRRDCEQQGGCAGQEGKGRVRRYLARTYQRSGGILTDSHSIGCFRKLSARGWSEVFETRSVRPRRPTAVAVRGAQNIPNRVDATQWRLYPLDMTLSLRLLTRVIDMRLHRLRRDWREDWDPEVHVRHFGRSWRRYCTSCRGDDAKSRHMNSSSQAPKMIARL